MKESKSRLTTIDVEALKESIANNHGDVKVIIVEEKDMEMSNLLEVLSDLTIYKVNNNEDTNLKGLQVRSSFYNIDKIKVETINLEDEKEILINGVVSIPKVGKTKLAILDQHFLNEEDARAVCQALNEYELDRLEEMTEQIAKARTFRASILDKA